MCFVILVVGMDWRSVLEFGMGVEEVGEEKASITTSLTAGRVVWTENIGVLETVSDELLDLGKRL